MSLVGGYLLLFVGAGEIESCDPYGIVESYAQDSKFHAPALSRAIFFM